MTIRRYWRGGLKRPLILVMVVLVAEIVLVASVASAQGVGNTPAALVSNHDQRDPDGFLTRGGTVFQGFTTGGNPGGYQLSEVSVVLLVPPPDPPDTEDVHEQPGSLVREAAPEYRVEIWSEKGTIITMPGQRLLRFPPFRGGMLYKEELCPDREEISTGSSAMVLFGSSRRRAGRWPMWPGSWV